MPGSYEIDFELTNWFKIYLVHTRLILNMQIALRYVWSVRDWFKTYELLKDMPRNYNF